MGLAGVVFRVVIIGAIAIESSGSAAWTKAAAGQGTSKVKLAWQEEATAH